MKSASTQYAIGAKASLRYKLIDEVIQVTFLLPSPLGFLRLPERPSIIDGRYRHDISSNRASDSEDVQFLADAQYLQGSGISLPYV